jgi:hypothetical protein
MVRILLMLPCLWPTYPIARPSTAAGRVFEVGRDELLDLIRS